MRSRRNRGATPFQTVSLCNFTRSKARDCNDRITGIEWEWDITYNLMVFDRQQGHFMGETHKVLRIRGRELLLFRIVYEVRYADGDVYFDRAGRVVRQLRRDSADWLPVRSAEHTKLASIVNGGQFTFNSKKMDGVIEQGAGEAALTDADCVSFAEQAAEISETVISELAISQFLRIGCRVWYLAGASDKADGVDWVQSLEIFSVNPRVAAEFGGTIKDFLFLSEFPGEDRNYRFGVDTWTRQQKLELGQTTIQLDPKSLHTNQREAFKKKLKLQRRIEQNPEYAISFDLDSYLDDPVEVDVKDFILTSYKKFHSAIVSICNAK